MQIVRCDDTPVVTDNAAFGMGVCVPIPDGGQVLVVLMRVLGAAGRLSGGAAPYG
jgi:hypothetical protein